VSRSALIVAGALFALGVLVWLLTAAREDPAIPLHAPSTPGIPPAAAVAPADTVPANSPLPGVTAPVDLAAPRITTREELARVLKARGLDADRLIDKYQDWRAERGFLGGDPLAGVRTEDSLSSVYTAMARPTQKSLADEGDLGALQAYAAGSLPGDPFTAIEYYRRASELGSAAAMADLARVLADVGAAPISGFPNDKAFAERLLSLRGGNPARDLRIDAVAWTLAAVRQYGPILATPDNLKLVDSLTQTADPLTLTAICGQSLAILGALSAATTGLDTSALPPVFLTEKAVYERLPCRDTPAPVTPPRTLAACASSPATGSNNQPVELWICPGN
jgi:hypothetical protein